MVFFIVVGLFMCFVAPEKIEIVYGKHEIVAQAFVYGDSLQSTLVSIIGIYSFWRLVNGIAFSSS